MKKEVRFPIFMERFNELKGDMTQTNFGRKLGMSRATTSFYCNGDRVPDALGIAKIAKVCGVTSDWLLGLEDGPVQIQKDENMMNELKIPQTDADIKEILCKQLVLLAERSEYCDIGELAEITRGMVRLADLLSDFGYSPYDD